MRVVISMIAALTALSFGAAPQQTPPSSSLVCYTAAMEDTVLNERRARDLCQGARTRWPVDCYSAARDRTVLSSRRSIRLCQCAESLRPVDCYERAEDQTILSPREIVQMCNARALNKVELPYCTAIDDDRGL